MTPGFQDQGGWFPTEPDGFMKMIGEKVKRVGMGSPASSPLMCVASSQYAGGRINTSSA